MATPVFSPSSFAAGELAPALFGHADLQRNHAGAATLRNMFPRITGGAYSRAGTKFIGYSLASGAAYPPRLIPFQFSVRQGRILEFVDFGMRVIDDGAFVTDGSLYTSAATNTKPLTVTISSSGGSAATPINTGVTASYAPGEVVGLEGGNFTIPAFVTIDTTILLSIAPKLGTGSGYAPGDTIILNGGTTNPQLLVASTEVNTISVVSAGTGGTPGLATITGTTGTGTPFAAQVLIGSGGTITSLQTLSAGGVYTVNPTSLAAEPVTGGGLTGATVKIAMGPYQTSITNPGVFSSNPSNTMTQLSSSGAGTGAVFINPLMGAGAVSIEQEGAYTVFPPDPTSQYSTTGSGQGLMFHMGWAGGTSSYNLGDWITFAGIGGMTELNGQTLIISNVSGNIYSFQDVCGNDVDATAWGVYTSAGTASRIYVTPSPYAGQDLRWIKYTQSADVMSLCCVNQDSLVEYPPYDLKRFADNNWQFVEVDFAQTISPPGAVNVTGSYNWALNSFTDMTDYPNPLTASYAYCVTAVNPLDGTESVASPVNGILGAVDIASNQGSITVTWSPVPPTPGSGTTKIPTQLYNIYKATPVSAWGYYPNPVPIGALFGFAAQSFGTQWTDQNVVADFEQTPPLHVNPFARGTITAVNVINGGNAYPWAGTRVQVNTSTGSGAVIEPVILNSGYGDASGGFDTPAQHNGPIVAYIVKDGGKNYDPSDTITIIGTNLGLALASPVVGPSSGTYPSVPSYYQQRRIYAGTLNDPDTYWMSTVGSYLNMNTRIPTIDSDAIQGTPWTLQVNGIQWMVPMPGGVMTFTGNSAWIVGGPGSSPINPLPITPANQQAQPMVFNGASPTVPPVRIEGDLVYLQSKGTIYRDLTLLNYFVNYYTGQDITVNSPHLFLNYGIMEHAWCEEPYKLLWSVRDDGAFLSMTYYKPEKVLGWARHDTFGKVLSVASVIEPPVDALYMAVLRPICLNGGCAITIERMDNRLWNDVQSVWAVDCALAYPQGYPDAILQISAPDGDGAVVGINNLVGGQNYSPSTYAYVVDNNGLGSGAGASILITVSGGVITTATVASSGTGYSNPALVIEDPTGQGSGASGIIVLETAAVFLTSDAGTFQPGDVGSVIRAAGGMATITAFVSGQEVIGNFVIPMSAFMPEINQGLYLPNIPPGDWTLTQPAQVIGGLWHLVGQSVTGLADGEVITPRIVNSKGEITLDAPATQIVVGLGFTAQLQSMYVDVGEPTAQGQRKKVGAVTARVDASRDFLMGANQIDGSTLSPLQLGPTWTNMEPVPNLGKAPYQAENLAQAPVPLWTGDVRIPVINGVGKPGQVALMQDNPLPLNVLSLMPEIMAGDIPEQQIKPRAKGKQQ